MIIPPKATATQASVIRADRKNKCLNFLDPFLPILFFTFVPQSPLIYNLIIFKIYFTYS